MQYLDFSEYSDTIFMKCTPKVGQKTFGVYYVKEETQEAQPIRLSSLYAYDRRWL